MPGHCTHLIKIRLWSALGLSIVLQFAVIYVPVLQNAFSTMGLSLNDWLLCTAVASSVLWLRELNKIIRRALANKTPRPSSPS